MAVLGVIFLRHATNRYNEALREIQEDQAMGKMPKRSLTAADFKKRRALLLPKEARYDTLLALPEVEVLILDTLCAALPTPPFTLEEKESAARRIYQHVWQQSTSGAFATEG